jgi:solute:Na+ symporter, SSS family
MVVSALYATHALGGWTGLHAALIAKVGAGKASGFTEITGAGARQILAYGAILVPSFICSPGLAQKLYGAKDVRAVRAGIGLNSIGQFLFAFVPALFGMVALARFGHLGNAEFALPQVIMKLVPPWLGMWALAAVFSAELSATDAILFMLSTSLAVDLYRTFVNPGVTQKKLLTVGRVTTFFAGAAGIALAISLPSVIDAVKIFYSLLAVALFVPFLLGLYWQRMSAAAALASIVVAILADLFVQYGTAAHSLGIISPAAAGIFAGFATAILTSAVAPNMKAAAVTATAE